MLQRHADWFSVLKVGLEARNRAAAIMAETLDISQGMMHARDIEALTALLLAQRPKRIFEIGTYRGASSEMMLRLLPEARVVSIAFVNPAETRQFNNADLGEDEVGALVSPANRVRYTQLIGDSHRIDPAAFVREHGQMDLVFIDGDHSRDGVRQDTELADAILAPGGAIAWHDANPKKRYIGSRLFLEEDMARLALATTDDFIGGVALWTEALERQLRAVAAAAV